MCPHSNFKIFNVATNFTPDMVIENVLGGKAEPKGWAITEVVEKGDGAWAKVRSSTAARLPLINENLTNKLSTQQGTTIEYGGDRAGSSLSSMGWTGRRGDSLPPVWVVVHKA